MKFFRCKICNQVHIKLLDNDTLLFCCNKQVEELRPNREGEKIIHIPQVRRIGNFVTVTVGEELHPMVNIHNIVFILLETNKGIQYKYLKKNELPMADFIITNDEEILNVYVYCTLHSLWSLH